jgi:hypothetical protein
MASIITVPNDNDAVMNADRQRLVPWAATHGWVFTAYNDQSDHVAQIRQAAGGTPIDVLDFDCHGGPGEFDATFSGTALQFGKSLAQIPGFTTSTSIFLDACNTGLTSSFASVSIAQILADGSRCTVYGTKGYMTGTYAEGTEQCYAGPNLSPPNGPLPAYLGAQTASGRNVWIPYQPRGSKETDIGGLHSMTLGFDQAGRVWATFDPKTFRETQMIQASSLTVQSQVRATRELEDFLDGIMRSKHVEFPALRIAPDITINYVREDKVTILDVYANGGLLKDRISGKTWRVSKPEEFVALIRQSMPPQ